MVEQIVRVMTAGDPPLFLQLVIVNSIFVVWYALTRIGRRSDWERRPTGLVYVLLVCGNLGLVVHALAR